MTFVLAYIIACHYHVVINHDDKKWTDDPAEGPAVEYFEKKTIADSTVQSRDSRP